MKAFILSAGLGTRLRPLTYTLPKPLLPVFGRPAILQIIDHLKAAGVEDVFLNTHHLPNTFREVLGGGSKFGVDIKYSFEKVLLDTGGGLKKVERYFKDETFIMYNSDVITNVDLREMVSFHKKNRNYVTLLASDKHDPKHLRVNKQGRVLSIEPRVVSGGHTFCGIHIIEPDIFKYIPKNMPISIIPIYRKLIEQGFSICVFPVKNAFWQEIGSRDSYEEINAK